MRAPRSARLAAHLQTDPRWASAKRVAAFVGIGAEPDTSALLEAALAAGKSVWLPRVLDARGGLTELVELSSPDSLRALVHAGYGLREPPAGAGAVVQRITPELGLDVVLIPGLGFDPFGGRIGHGPGHYDRLLSPVRDSDPPWRVGACLSEFLAADPDPDPSPNADMRLPMEAHDVPMHAVVTDAGLLACLPRS